MRDEKERERPTWRGGSGPLEIRPMASLSQVKPLMIFIQQTTFRKYTTANLISQWSNKLWHMLS